MAGRRPAAHPATLGYDISAGRDLDHRHRRPVARLYSPRVPTERVDEALARKLVQHVLGGVSVDRYEDGSRNGMVDATITYADGTVAALEVVGDHDPNYRSLDDAIRKGGARIGAPTLRNTWILNLKDHADVRTIRENIAPILEALEAAFLPGNLKWPDGRLSDDRSQDCRSIHPFRRAVR